MERPTADTSYGAVCPAFSSPWWLPGGHLQTIFPALLNRSPQPPYLRQTLATPDNDFIDCDWLPSVAPERPLLILFHGLEGSSRSHYARQITQAANALGWTTVVPHFRGCSGRPNRQPRAYHSGDTDEIDWLVRQLCALTPHRSALYVAGVSLGGNALLKWLGEQGAEASHVVDAAAAICPPLDLNICGRALDRGFNRIYVRHFLKTLKPKALAKLEAHRGLFDEARLRKAHSLFEFDDVFTGPIHGFAGAEDYWTKASSRPWLHRIAPPTLLLTAANDPFVPASALPQPNESAPALTHCHLDAGGHVGFTQPPWPGRYDWLANLITAFLADDNGRTVLTRPPTTAPLKA